LHLNILNEQQRTLLPCLAEVAADKFYLAGGTALALQLGHRLSVDFDWFTPTVGNCEELLSKIKRLCGDGEPRVLSMSHETLHLQIRGVQVSFLGYDYPLLQPLVPWLDFGCALADIRDIACMKLSAITGRGARKDFIDLHQIILNHYDLRTCLSFFQQKYRQHDIGHVVRSLTYFADADLEPEIVLYNPQTAWQVIKSDLIKRVKAL
jgi:hypothetical protein